MELVEIVYLLAKGYTLVEKKNEVYLEESYKSQKLEITSLQLNWLLYYHLVEHDSGNFDYGETFYKFNRDFAKTCKETRITIDPIKSTIEKVNLKFKLDILLK